MDRQRCRQGLEAQSKNITVSNTSNSGTVVLNSSHDSLLYQIKATTGRGDGEAMKRVLGNLNQDEYLKN